MQALNPFIRPVYVTAKPAGPRCNLHCDYCYYLSKAKLYADGGHATHETHAPGHLMMDDRTLEAFVKQYIESQPTAQVLFTWHGGEPMLRPLSFYRKAIALQRKYAEGRQIDNCIQTNGTLIDDARASFLHDNGWLVGLSIDGPEHLHDACRHTPAGKGTFSRVMRAAAMLDKHGVEWNAMATVNSANVRHPVEFYHFFKSIGCHYLQFTPVVDSDRLGRLSPYSIGPEQWGEFVCTVFDEWVGHDVGTYFVQLFDATLANWAGVAPGVCALSATCGNAAALEFNGDVYCCDHFVYPEYRLGNLGKVPLTVLLNSRRQRAFGLAKRSRLPLQCKTCRWLFACHGECPKNRFALSDDGEPGLNYLCHGYRRFFGHAAPYMDFMKARLDCGEAPADIVWAIRQGWKP